MKVKICGFTDLNDLIAAAKAGIDYAGIIFASRSLRCVSLRHGKSLARLATSLGITPVAVFVEQEQEEIIEICDALEIKTIQLHGFSRRCAFLEMARSYSIIYAIKDGEVSLASLLKNLPESVMLLYDSAMPGSGQRADWNDLQPPHGRFWGLAGGLNPENVAAAVAQLKPHFVDVATGVETAQIGRKDYRRMKSFVEAAKLRNIC